ncbi:MAG: adenosine kinase, partial [Pseudomonadota bacterium]
RAELLYAAMSEREETPGGSVANTLAGLGMLGCKTAFIGRVANDALGRNYAQAMVDQGTDFPNTPIPGAELPSSRSMIFVSANGERSMNTYLGISTEVGPEDVADDVINDCDILLLEGYLFDKSPGKAAFRKAAGLARAAGAKAGITLSDPFCVDRHRDDFRTLVAGPLNYVMANEIELTSLYQVSDLDRALDLAVEECELVVCTRSGKGVAMREGDRRIDVPVEQRIVPVDTTGAGDQFAAGFLYGVLRGADLTTCGRMGNVIAGETICHLGPRPKSDLKALLARNGLG